jgi:ribosomal protein S18 acetylase RimI-like enzyme
VAAVEPLDNPVWHALSGPHQHLADRHGRAVRYRREVAPFAALPDRPGTRDWADLAALVGSGSLAVLFRDQVERPSGWQEVFRMRALQMVGAAVEGCPAGEAEELGSGDVEQARALVELTDPGPFAVRTMDMGIYLGVRHRRRLVALAGERMHLSGHHEISLVCTHPEHRCRGLGTALVLDLVARIRGRGDVPFLHVLEGNDPAIRLYAALGFEERRWVDVVGVVAP